MTQPKRQIQAIQYERRRPFWAVTFVTLVILSATGGTSQSATDQIGSRGWESGLVRSVVGAPVVPDGTTAGHVTDFVINLAVDMNPVVAGRSLAAGRTIRVVLPSAFQRDPSIPFRTFLSDPGCVPGNITCNTMFLLQGWPQHPVGFPPVNMPSLWTVAFEETTNTVVLTALQDLIANPPNEPGIKQIHMLLAGFINPAPGLYHVGVIAETGPGGQAESGWGRLLVRPRVAPHIAIASAFNAGAPNTIYQTTLAGSLTPRPYDLLLWNEQGAPLLNVTTRQISAHSALLVQGNREVGLIRIETPPGATGQQVFTPVSSFQVNSPVVGVSAGRLTVFFATGEIPGEYVLHFELSGGNTVETSIAAQ